MMNEKLNAEPERSSDLSARLTILKETNLICDNWLPQQNLIRALAAVQTAERHFRHHRRSYYVMPPG